jgi:hypothetical protein
LDFGVYRESGIGFLEFVVGDEGLEFDSFIIGWSWSTKVGKNLLFLLCSSLRIQKLRSIK